VNIARTILLSLVLAPTAVVGAGCDLAQPLTGPGLTISGELTTDAPGPFTVSTTKLILKEGDRDAQGLFDDNMEAMNAVVQEAPGLVAVAMSQTIGGATYRTLSVWESEETMLEWVVGETHGEAMAALADHADPTSSVTSWQLTRAELEAQAPTWDDAKAHLDADGREVY
jgi:heme-degrading monooxygenase HmoA